MSLCIIQPPNSTLPFFPPHVLYTSYLLVKAATTGVSKQEKENRIKRGRWGGLMIPVDQKDDYLEIKKNECKVELLFPPLPWILEKGKHNHVCTWKVPLCSMCQLAPVDTWTKPPGEILEFLHNYTWRCSVIQSYKPLMFGSVWF